MNEDIIGLRKIPLWEAIARISKEKIAIFYGLSAKQIICIANKMQIAGVKRPFKDEDIESLKIRRT